MAPPPVIGALRVKIGFRPDADRGPSPHVVNVQETRSPGNRFLLGCLHPEHISKREVMDRAMRSAMEQAMRLLAEGKVTPAQVVTITMPGSEIRRKFVTEADLKPVG